MPRLFDCFQMSELSYTKGENRVCPKALGYLANGWTHGGTGPGGGDMDLCGAQGVDTRVRK